ncbi:GH25 family lysozyme, partial [Arthrobacter ruber]|uniref:GH25 family lysozyme n=1 Tax=Arthrobacter ruber TaxID=1258893 RepID=UPI0023E77C18
MSTAIILNPSVAAAQTQPNFPATTQDSGATSDAQDVTKQALSTPSASVIAPLTTSSGEALTAEQMLANSRALATEMDADGASLGQGVRRLSRTGDAQVPAPEESTSNTAPEGQEGLAAVNYWKPGGVLGVDVSSHQGTVNWQSAWNQGARFAYTKATESTNYRNPFFDAQYNGSSNVGMLRGAYHFAIPSVSSGSQQANYFINNGGGWSSDGRTLPPLLDVEYNPYPSLGNACYNMSPAQMVTWIRDFSNTVLARTGRVPMIYTTTDWWDTCTGRSTAFGNHPLHLASYSNAGPGRMPAGWSGYDLWQYTSEGPVIGDWNQWPGSMATLQSFARNGQSGAGSAIGAVAARTPELGAATSGVVCGLVAGGCYQNFQGGAVTWTAGSGAHATING